MKDKEQRVIDTVAKVVAKAKRRIRSQKIMEAKPKKPLRGFGYLCGCSYCVEQLKALHQSK